MRKFACTFLLIVFTQMMSYSLYYTVKENDSIWALSRQYNIQSELIIKINELYQEHIYSGQTLFIPDSILDYTVQSGDNLSRIAQTYNTKVKYIIILNNMADETLRISQKIRIPVNESGNAKDAPQQEYFVKSGDSLSQIARDFSVSIEDIKKWNNKKEDQVYIGEKLILFTDKKQESHPETPPASTYYTVQAGDNLESIAQKYNVSVAQIKSWNNKESDTIYVGEKLRLESSTVNSSPSTHTITYKVKSGDNLSSLSARYHVSIEEIKALNKLKRDELYIDEVLKIKTSYDEDKTASVNPVKKRFYSVRRGDSLSEIARNYQVSVDDIVKWNKKNNKNVYIGEKLTIYSNIKMSPYKNQAIVSSGPDKVVVKWDDIRHHPVPQDHVQYLSQTEKGLILHLSRRTGVRCIAAGIVEYAGFLKTKNYVVIINHGNEKRMVYGYMSQISVQAGDKVKAGDTIGISDYLSIHNSTPLLLELYEDTQVVDIFSLYPYLRKVRFTAFK